MCKKQEEFLIATIILKGPDTSFYGWLALTPVQMGYGTTSSINHKPAPKKGHAPVITKGYTSYHLVNKPANVNFCKKNYFSGIDLHFIGLGEF